MESIQTPQNWLKSLNEILQNTQCQRRGEDVPLESAYQSFEEIVIQVRSQGKRVWWIGNGGSSALCQHLSQDLLNKLNVKSQTLAEVPLLTCMANDFGYSEIYRRPLRTLA